MIYIVIFNVLMVISLLLAVSNNKSKFLFLFFSIALALIAGFRDGSLFFDYSEYQDSIIDPDESRYEISFLWIISLVKGLGLPMIAVFLVYAILGVGLKTKAILDFKASIWLSVMVYIAHLYIAEECTAIRVGVATGFLLLALLELCNKRIRYWLIYTFFAILFHYSAFLGLLYPLIIKIPVKLKYCIPLLVVAYLMPLFDLSVNVLFYYFDNTFIDYYSHYTQTEEEVNIFNFSQMLYCILALYVIKNIEEIKSYNEYAGKLVMVYLFSLIVIPVFNAVPVFAFRIAHIFACVEIILIPLIIQHFWYKKGYRIFSYLLVAYLFYWCNITALGSMNY